jgi:hypothetical protein
VSEWFIVGLGLYFLFNGIAWATHFGMYGCYCIKDPDDDYVYPTGCILNNKYCDSYISDSYYDEDFYEYGVSDDEIIDHFFNSHSYTQINDYCPFTTHWSYVVLFIFGV